MPLAGNANSHLADDPENVTRTRKVGNREVREVLVVNDDYNVTGSYLQNVRAGQGLEGPTVNITFNTQGAQLFGGLTGHNLPDEVLGFRRKLGIILDGALFSAPYIRSTITDNAEISGGHMTQKEVDATVNVLNAGSLPVRLREVKAK